VHKKERKGKKLNQLFPTHVPATCQQPLIYFIVEELHDLLNMKLNISTNDRFPPSR
jgi:hypothetical protein